ncbi:MAG: TonB-dependent receptor [Bacteroidales bacterium]|nr:TonB-dependent receptor [Bacteroidales bacterium]
MKLYSLSTLTIVFSLILFSANSVAQDIDTSSTSNLFELSLDDLMDIEIVSAIRQNQNITDAPSIVSVITETQIKERGYASVAEALNSVAGFDVITDYFQPNMGTRGINGGLRSWSRLVKVMIDGQNTSFRSSSDNYLDPSLIPLEAIERIEIIRGPNSALYGKNAFLGVINIITKNGAGLENSISHYIGSVNDNATFNISTIWGGSKNNFDIMFSSSYSQIDYSGISPHNVPGSTIYGSGDVAHRNESNPLSVYFKVKYEEESFGKLILDFNQQNINSFAEFLDWGTLTHNNRISLLNAYERLSYTKDISGNFQTNISFTHSTGKPIKNEILDNDADPSEWIERELGYSAYDLSFNSSYSFDDINNFSFGIDYTTDIHEHQKFYTVNTSGIRTLNPGGTDGIENFNNLGVYLQMIFNAAEFFNFNYLKNLTLTAGYRFDYHNIYGDVLNYRLAAVYHLTDLLTTKVMYGTSFNAPSSVQLYSNYITPGGIVGNPDLKPERAKTLEWALMGKVFKYFNFNTNIYYTEIDDKIEYLLPNGQISNITAENVSNIYSTGVEAELNTNIHNNTSYLNYSYERSILEKTDPLLEEIRIKTALYPNHMIKFGNILHLHKYYSNINIEGKFISSRIDSDQNNFIYDPINYTINRYELDPYFILDVMITSTDLELLENSKTRISIRIQNLLNTKYYYPGFKNYDIPGLGRTFYFKFTQFI